MKQLVLSYPVEIALGTLPDAKRRRLLSLFEALRSWDDDPAIRDRSEPIPLRGMYLIPSANGMYVFFKPGADKITILDIANKETIEQFADAE